jgi:excinuclease ABC subunit A
VTTIAPAESKLDDKRTIRLRGVRVHNLKDVNIDIPRHQLVVVCGVSGSGKTSLALDTLYAEGQRRYIESFSAYTRQFLQRLDKPDCESIEGLPPAIAVTRAGGLRGNRSTVATATEIADYLRLFFAKLATLNCYQCGAPVRNFDPQSTTAAIASLPAGTRLMIGFPVQFANRLDASEVLEQLQLQGFLRIRIGTESYHLSSDNRLQMASVISATEPTMATVIVDRVTALDDTLRITESLETAFSEGEGRAILLVDSSAIAQVITQLVDSPLPVASNAQLQTCSIDGRSWTELSLNRSFRCDTCQIDYPAPEPRLFNFNQPLGACVQCEGFGDVMINDMELIVPDPSLSLAEGAIAPWNTPSYKHELEELLAIASKHRIPVDVPFSKLKARELEFIQQGSTTDNFGGLRGFFEWLDRKKYKMHVRVFLSRWRSYRKCPTCLGLRLKPTALAFHVQGNSFAQLTSLSVNQAAHFFHSVTLNERERGISREILAQLQSRLRYLQTVGLGHLTLDRTLRTLSGGENQRVSLTGTLGSSLVNMLYVLDEPTSGLHPHDVERLADAILELKNRGNSVVAVEHEQSLIQRADHLIEMGPGAGTAGGKVVYQGSLSGMLAEKNSLTGDFLAGRRGVLRDNPTRRQPRGTIELRGACGNNLKNLNVTFPLGVLCLVTGVSGSGKSSLVMQTLFGAINKRKRKSPVPTLPYDDVIGDGQLDDLMLVDQSPISRSPRSNPVTYIKAFDSIRELFADCIDAKTRGLTSGHFSFNSELGRCEICEGDGVQTIDMQFLADVTMQCPACKGSRYRPEILQIRYRDRNIADVLQMTVRQAMIFFRGQAKVLTKLQRLVDVGLDYVGLGQAATTFSSGEAQRLKLAGFLSSASRKRTLFLLDEPTTGLHFADIVQLIDCFDALLEAGHSLIVVEHNLQLMHAADYIIDLGPGAADEGGQVVATGTPETIMQEPRSKTGQAMLKKAPTV